MEYQDSHEATEFEILSSFKDCRNCGACDECQTFAEIKGIDTKKEEGGESEVCIINGRLVYKIVEPLETSETDERKVERLAEVQTCDVSFEFDTLNDLRDEKKDELASTKQRDDANENGNCEGEKKEIVENDEKMSDYFKEVENRNVAGETKGDNKRSGKTFDFSCPTCQHDLPFYGEYFSAVLEDCRHIICRECVKKMLHDIINYKTTELRCSFDEGAFICNALIKEHEIRDLVELDLYEKYLDVTFDKIKKDAGNRVFYCKTRKCPGWCIVEDNNVKSFFCPVCKVDNYVDLNDNQKVQEVSDEEEKYVQSERYNEMLLLLENDIIPNFEPFDCPICFVSYLPQEGLVLKNCLHIFCKACIANTVLYSEDVDIKCPYKNDDYSCEATIQQSEIKAVVTPEDFQKYLNRSIALAESKAGKSAFHCKTSDCPGWCVYEAGAEHFLCPVCNQDNCFLCQKIHTGSSCVPDTVVSEMSDALIEMMLNNGDALLCPNCNAVITKAEGCDAVICSACKTDICWVTRGPRWGPKGRGDISGGCKCNVIRKCHPNCNNCH